ncbi:MAG: hypothetical protein ACOX4U_05125 [Anaerovoracaceae bacterium]|jgi:hypothetical protein
MQKRTVTTITIVLICLLVACSSMPQSEDNIGHDNPESDEITPYTFLHLICGNAEELSFTCFVEGAGRNTLTFQIKGDEAVETFVAKDMNGNPVSVRVIEKDGKVHYIMDDSKIIKIYLSPAEDFLLFRMLAAVNTLPDLTTEIDGYYLYEHSLPFVQDESMQYKYIFYMKDGVLKKLTISLRDEDTVTYQFSDFRQELLDATAFEIPEGYIKEEFSYTNTGEHMPPWWEIGNDE